MKKIFHLFILLIFCASKVFAGDYYFVGVDCFKKGDYQKASKNFETAIRINPNNVNARYYLAQSYLKQKRTSDAIEQYNRIIILSPDSDASRLSERGLALIKQSQSSAQQSSFDLNEDLSKYKDNYLNYISSGNNEVKKWEKFPLKVYIEPSSHNQVCKKAFSQWQIKTGGMAKFTYTNNPSEAQILVKFKDKLEASQTGEAYIAGLCAPYYQGNKIVKSDILMLTKNPNSGKEFSDEEFFTTMLHEIGHSLGIKGHSPTAEDIMYANSKSANADISKRDLNTLNLIYKTKLAYLMNKNNIGSDPRLTQAIQYANSIPDKAIGWNNLANLYKEKGMYSLSIQNYKKAAAIEPENPKIHNNLGSVYNKLGDLKNAFVSYKKAYELEKSNIDYLADFYSICTQTGQKTTGISYIKNHLKENPEAASDERMKLLLNTYN